MKIYVDADACPVKEIIIQEATKRRIPVVLVQSFSHFSNAQQPDGVDTVYVDAGAEAADYKIMKLARKQDVIITQDYGLAALVLGKGCIVLHHKGFMYTAKNIDQLLTTRHANAKARKSGYKTKGPKALTNEDREKFRSVFLEVIETTT
ncbi:YaiI/YqxD family protein [Aquibacillus sediminis]|uniref:YaiI/YqxD family protein n=1 Tax=Aquibacillus sediminis TaxID=2574734 RepID=UPI001108757F|nr:YaiI/YqxD family protein [Aquibacillus sediminis]